MKHKITRNELLNFARKNTGNYFPTVARGRPFMVEVRGSEVVCHPLVSKELFWLSLDKQVPCFNSAAIEDKFRPKNYPGETFTNSYFVGLVHAMCYGTKPLSKDQLPKPDSRPRQPSPDFDREVARLRKLGNSTPPLGQEKPNKREVTTYQYDRDPDVKAWVLRTSEGKCEYCKEPAPFKDDNNLPFLEVHHVKPLSEKGPDMICNAVALCPNCHRAMHQAKDRKKRVAQLYQRFSRLKK